MYMLSEQAMAALVTERRQVSLVQARQARYAHTLTELRRAERSSKRASRQLLRAWQRSDELRAALDVR